MTPQVVTSDSHPASARTQELESHLMGDDVLEEIAPLNLRIASVPTALHHRFCPLAASRGILHGLVGPGKVRCNVVLPVPDGFECVIEGHLDCAVIAPKTPHHACGRKRRLWLEVRDPDNSFLRRLWLHAGGFSEAPPLSLPEWVKDVLRRSTLVVVVVFSLGRGMGGL